MKSSSYAMASSINFSASLNPPSTYIAPMSDSNASDKIDLFHIINTINTTNLVKSKIDILKKIKNSNN